MAHKPGSYLDFDVTIPDDALGHNDGKALVRATMLKLLKSASLDQLDRLAQAVEREGTAALIGVTAAEVRNLAARRRGKASAPI